MLNKWTSAGALPWTPIQTPLLNLWKNPTKQEKSTKKEKREREKMGEKWEMDKIRSKNTKAG